MKTPFSNFVCVRQGDEALASRDFDHNNVYCFIRLYCSVLKRTHWSESNRIDDCRWKSTMISHTKSSYKWSFVIQWFLLLKTETLNRVAGLRGLSRAKLALKADLCPGEDILCDICFNLPISRLFFALYRVQWENNPSFLFI